VLGKSRSRDTTHAPSAIVASESSAVQRIIDRCSRAIVRSFVQSGSSHGSCRLRLLTGATVVLMTWSKICDAV
jgi:hypothetical protein